MERIAIYEGIKWRSAAFKDHLTNKNPEKNSWTIKFLRRYQRTEKSSHNGKKIFLQF
jgi:hypothetical protein